MKKPIDGKVYTVAKETEKVVAPDLAPKKRTLPEALRKNLWKLGQSGNPVGGRPKAVSTEIRNFLSRKVPVQVAMPKVVYQDIKTRLLAFSDSRGLELRE